MTNILAIHAHPDDIETVAAGALAILAGKGTRITIVTMTAGECGTAQGDPIRTGDIRRAEAKVAAEMIGAAYRCVGLPDLGVFNDDHARRATTEIIRWARPDVVITAPLADYHPDHEATGLIVRDACFAASAGAYLTGEAAALEAIPHLYFTDPIGGRTRDGSLVTAEFAADIEAVMPIKRRMLQAHQSQVAWLEKQHQITDFTASMEAQGRRRGAEFGVKFAEGFCQYRHHPYPRGPALQSLLGDAILTDAA